jgi:hypothetical protein
VPRLEESSFELVTAASRAWPLRESDVRQCSQKSGLGNILSSSTVLNERIKIDWTEPPTPSVEWLGPSRVGVPCSALIKDDQTAGKRNERCAASDNPQDRGIAWLQGYRDAMIYVPSDSSLNEIVRSLLAWQPDGRPVFRLDSAYEGALVRFGVLSTLINLISLPLAFGLGLLYLAVSSVILVITFQHRRAQYGLLVMNGVRPEQIRDIVVMQVALGYAIGSAVGYLLFAISVWGVNDWLAGREIIRNAASLIGLDVPKFLSPLSGVEILWIAGGMTIVSLILANFILRLQGITNAKSPIELIKS